MVVWGGAACQVLRGSRVKPPSPLAQPAYAAVDEANQQLAPVAAGATHQLGCRICRADGLSRQLPPPELRACRRHYRQNACKHQEDGCSLLLASSACGGV